MKNQTEFQKGIELKRQGKFEEAIAAYRRSIETNPGFSWTYYMLGETLAELGRLEEAVSSYKKAIALNSEPDCFHSKLEQALNQLDCQDVKGLVNSNSKTSNLDEIQAPIKGELETKGQVNHAFLSMSRKFWNVNSMQEAMFDRVITGPEFNRLPLEKKIELWEKSAVASVEQILQDIPVKQEWKVLDIGCGVGRCIKPMRDLFLEVDGVDISAKMIEFAKEYLSDGKQNGKLYVNSGSDLSQLQNINYDFVYSMIVFQHIRSISVVKSYFQEIYRVLKYGGYFKLQVHDASNSNLGTFDEEAQEDQQYTFSGNSYTPDELQELLKTSNFDVITIKHQTPWIWATVQKPKDLQTYFEELNQLDVESAIDHYKKCYPVSQEWLSLYYKNVYRLLFRITPGEIYVKYLELLKPLFENVKYQSSCQNIYQCCIPKTGSQWLRQILADVRVFEYSGLTPFPAELFYQTQGTFLPVNTIVNGTFCLMFDIYLSLKKPNNYKTFFIKRDPRDYIISNYFSTKFSHEPIADIPQLREKLKKMSVEDGIIEIIYDNQKKNLFELMRSWIDADQKDPNVMILKFEDLVGVDQFAVMKKMFSHCDVQIPDNILQSLIDDYSFDKLSSGRKQGQENEMSHYRKGTPGDWKNYFTEKIEDKFYEVTGNLVKDLGY